MNKLAEQIISIKILGHNYNIKCPSDAAHELQRSATYLNEQMSKLKQNSSHISTDRVAIVAALNITHELICLKKQKNQSIEVTNQRIQELKNKIEGFIATNKEIAV